MFSHADGGQPLGNRYFINDLQEEHVQRLQKLKSRQPHRNMGKGSEATPHQRDAREHQTAHHWGGHSCTPPSAVPEKGCRPDRDSDPRRMWSLTSPLLDRFLGETWVYMSTQSLPRSQNVLTVPTCHACVEPEYPHGPHKSCPGVRMSSQSHCPHMFYLKVRTFPLC